MASGNSQRPAGAARHGRPADVDPDEIAQRVSEKVSAKMQQATEKLSLKADKLSSKADKLHHKAEILERIGPAVTEALDVWTRQAPGARQPRFGLDDLAAAAMKIADDEGIAALSMRRLASELGAGTMTLYHYVRTKDELLALVTDAVMAELIVAEEELDTDWRTGITMLARRSKAAFEAHPWMFDIVEDPALGPNGVRHFDQSIHAVATLPGTMADKLDVITAVDEFVFGHCMHNRHDHTHGKDANERAMLDYVLDLVATGGYPHIGGLIDELGVDPAWELITEHHNDATRFDRNLSRLLDGIEAAIQR